MTKFDETALRELSWDNLKAVAKENGVQVRQKRDKITEELLKIGRPKMTQLARLRGDKSAIKMEKIRRRTVGHVKTPPRPTSSRGAGTRRTRASTSRRAPEPEPEPEPEPQPEAVDAATPAATPSEGRAEPKPEEELPPLERARARYRLEREQEERERRAKEEAALAQAESENLKPAAVIPPESQPPRSERRVLFPMGVHVPFEPLKPRRTPGLRREDMPDEWRVGLLSPDPSNPRPVFSPPTKPRDEPEKRKDSSGLPLAPAPQGKEVECAPLVEGQEQADEVDTDTELAEEEEVFEMTSLNDIHVELPDDKAPVHVDEGEKTVRERKRKTEDDEEKTMTALEQSPKKRRRTSFRGWLLGKVF